MIWTGSRLRVLQECLGLTNEGIARTIHVSTRSVANWRKSHAELPRLAQNELKRFVESLSGKDHERFELAELRSRATPEPGNNEIADQVQHVSNLVDDELLELAASCSSDTIEQLQLQSLAIARGIRAPLDTFVDAQRIWRQAKRLIATARRPSDLADLYLIAGQGAALMASTTFDLHRWKEADRIIQLASAYASLSGDASLQSWTLGLQASMHNWRQEPTVALPLLTKAEKLAPAGEPKVRVRYIRARSSALMGDARDVKRTLDLAQNDLSTARHDTLSHDVGGEFAFPTSRAHACAAAAWLDLGNGDETEVHAIRAIDELRSLPIGIQPVSQLAGARIDLAAGRLLGGDADAASDALREVLTLAPNSGNASLAGRMNRVRELLAKRADSSSKELAHGVESWLSDAPGTG